MKVLVIGRGAREHALGWKLKQSRLLSELFFAPGNSATSSLGENIKLAPTQIVELADWAAANGIDLTVVGPEISLILGIKEAFSRRGLSLFGPSEDGAKLEGSKIWSKEFLERHGIPTALARSFDAHDAAVHYVSGRRFPLVIKAEGLAEGKGVRLCGNSREAESALKEFMLDKSLGTAGERVLVEDFLVGEEISAFALFDGHRMCYLGEARDYKRALDGDQGPNTGGMGAVSDHSLIDEGTRSVICDQIFKPTFEGLKKEGIEYQGVLYAGLMLTREGPKVLEFNVRFGDPEAQVLFPSIDDDLLPILKNCADGNLKKEFVKLKSGCVLGVVVAALGYPGMPVKGNPLPDLNRAPNDLLIFHAATAVRGGTVVNEGGRTLTVVTQAPSISDARQKVYDYLGSLSWNGYFYRSDVGLLGTPLGHPWDSPGGQSPLETGLPGVSPGRLVS